MPDMAPNNNAAQQYLKAAVMTASPEQLQLMLLDGAIRFATRGGQALQERDYEASFNALDRAQRIVLELNNGLCREVNPPLVDQMAALYGFVYRRLVDANVTHDLQAIQDALKILRHQRETWAMLIDKIRRETAARPRPGVDSAAALSVEG